MRSILLYLALTFALSARALAQLTISDPATINILPGTGILNVDVGTTTGRIDLGTGPTGDTYNPVQWGGGSRWGLTATQTVFNGIPDYSGGIQYNPCGTAGDVAVGLLIESRYSVASPALNRTEFYYDHAGIQPSGTRSHPVAGPGARRVFLFATSLGENDPKPAGWTHAAWHVDKWSMAKTGLGSASGFILDFDANTLLWTGAAAISTTLSLGSTSAAALNIPDGGITLGGNLTFIGGGQLYNNAGLFQFLSGPGGNFQLATSDYGIALDIVSATGQVTIQPVIPSTTKDTGALVVKNGGLGVEQAINAGGDVATGGGIILKSPNGSRWRITVDNTGALVTTAL